MANPDLRTPANRGSSRSALIIVGVLALLGLAYSIARVDILRARITELRMIVETLQQHDITLRGQLAALDITQQRATTQLIELQAELAGLHDNIGDLRGRAEQAQRLAIRSEARYLLRLASQQLRLGGDFTDAGETLAAAETVLNDSGDSAIEVVHQQVAISLMQVRALPRVDVDSIAQQLSHAEQRVNNLKLVGILQSPGADAGAAPLPSAGVARAWTLFKHSLSSLLTIDKRGIAASQLVSGDEQVLRRRHLQVLLLSARLALRLHDQSGYLTAIDNASQWLNQRFDTQDAQVRQFSEQLTQLARHDIAPVTPDLSSSIQALSSQLAAAGVADP